MAGPSPKSSSAVAKWLIRVPDRGHYLVPMITFLLELLRLFPFLVGGHRQLALENLALRQQLAVYKRTVPRPKLRTMDRLFWVGLARAWTGWRQTLAIVSPDTVLRWQRRRFREWPAHTRHSSNTRRTYMRTRRVAH